MAKGKLLAALATAAAAVAGLALAWRFDLLGKIGGGSPSDTRNGRTREELYAEAKRLKIPGRSSMTKEQLERAIARADS